MFPRTNTNFTSGRYLPPAKNTAQQPSLFQRNNPYATQVPGLQPVLNQFGRGTSIGDISSILAGVRQQAQGAQSGVTSGVSAPPVNLQGLQSFAGATPAQLEALNQIAFGTPMERLAGTPVQMNTNPYITGAARQLVGALGTNPGITPEAKLQMARGYAPALNQINPMFWQYTSPVIQQALQGLYQSTGVRPEEQSFFREIWTPMGLS